MYPGLNEAWTSVARERCGFEGEPLCKRMFSTHSVDSTQDTETMPQSDNELSQQDTKDGKVKRKVGRPIAYSGDPFSPDLEPEQRRIILRRIANRESARRVRARRQDELDRLGQRVQGMDDSNSRLRVKLKASEAKEAHVRSELANLKGHLRRQTQESEALRGEVVKLKHMLTAAKEHKQLQMDMSFDKGTDLPPLLINPSAPLAPLQPGLAMCEPLEKPDTPTGKVPNPLISAFSEESAMQQPTYQGHPPPQALAAERTFSDFLQEINWELRS
ncbi:g6025 [Coccomyxa viridis]|uniref:G6025 protein n=1 Tax=Coccomyxa viridis TaxID=1274662 RepID=A0ABP1FWN7_9CHLO